MQSVLIFAFTLGLIPFAMACVGDRRAEKAPLIGIPLFAVGLLGVLTSNESPAAKGFGVSVCVTLIAILWNIRKKRLNNG